MFTCEPRDRTGRGTQYVCLICNYTGPRGPIAWYANEDEYDPQLAYEAAVWKLDGLVWWDQGMARWMWGTDPALDTYRVCQLQDCPRCTAKVATVDILP